MGTRYDEYKKMHSYGTEGNVNAISFNNKQYVLVDALGYVIDDYDEAIGSVELSHYESLGYRIVKAVDVLACDENLDLLDFTWMNSDDTIELEKSPLNQMIKRININIDNLDYITLPIEEGQLQNFGININAQNSKLNMIKTIKIMKNFIENYNEGITEGINLYGFDYAMTKIITHIAKKYNVEVKKDEVEKSK